MVDGFGPGFIPPNSTLRPSPNHRGRRWSFVKDDSTPYQVPTDPMVWTLQHAPPQFLSKTVSFSLILFYIELSQLVWCCQTVITEFTGLFSRLASNLLVHTCSKFDDFPKIIIFPFSLSITTLAFQVFRIYNCSISLGLMPEVFCSFSFPFCPLGREREREEKSIIPNVKPLCHT